MYCLSFFREFAPAFHLAISEDLFHWQELNAQEPILESKVSAQYFRDPFIIQDQSGTFHMLCTDGWESPKIIHTSSQDLVNWEDQQILNVMENFPSAKNAWAPEACYDAQRDEYLIFWSSTVPDAFPEHKNKPEKYLNHRIYACRTKDWLTFSETKLYFDPGFNCIDASINFNGDVYLMAFKDERGENTYFPDESAKKYILTAFTKDLDTEWKINFSPISSVIETEQGNSKASWAEGPCVFWDPDRQKWIITYEYFRNHTNGCAISHNGSSWDCFDKELHFPEGAKHATVFMVSNEKIENALKENYVLPIEDD